MYLKFKNPISNLLITVQKDGFENCFSVHYHWIFSGLLCGFGQIIGSAKVKIEQNEHYCRYKLVLCCDLEIMLTLASLATLLIDFWVFDMPDYPWP